MLWIPMLWVYCHYKYFYSYSAGIDFRRAESNPALQGLTPQALTELLNFNFQSIEVVSPYR